MTGTIKQVMVAVGDVVKEGDHVMMMEAMKMDMEISAHQGGTVSVILCKVGDGVKENQPLVTIE
jgi:biotin carboxyl carrier protein